MPLLSKNRKLLLQAQTNKGERMILQQSLILLIVGPILTLEIRFNPDLMFRTKLAYLSNRPKESCNYLNAVSDFLFHDQVV